MNAELPDGLREYLRTQNKELADRADNFWRISRSIIDRQSSPNSNENGQPHVEMVERNVWRLIKGAGKVDDFNSYELFLLSCGACSHDFDKGLIDEFSEGVGHGKGSGAFLTEENKALQLSIHEAVCIKKIIGIHALCDGRFQEELKNIDKIFPLSTGSVKLQKLAVILKSADILHTDDSRIASIGTDVSAMSPDEKNKHLARQSISGWDIDGSRIIINAVPKTHDHLNALDGCEKYIKEKEWPAVADKLSGYGFPCDLEFKVDRCICGELKELDKKSLDKPEQAGDLYGQDNYVFNVPYREKGDGVVGRENALQQLRRQLTESRGTSIGQAASFHGMGGLGKTQLAVEYSYRFRESYPNGVIWINADQEIDPQLIQISKKANWIAPESEHKLILEIAKRRLRIYSDCLIIFDNVDKYEDIKPYLPEPVATPHLILTSRKPQPGFQPIKIDILNEKDSLDLLMMESGRAFDGLSPEEQNAAKNIVIELGGLPLALEIAGAYLKYLSSFSFAKYHSILQSNPSSALPVRMLASFTAHESDLYRTLKVSESVFEQVPILKDILDVLTWSGSSFMGTSLLSAILDVDENSLFQPLSFGTELRILRKNETQDRYEIHRLLKKIRQEEFPLEKNREWAENICKRVGSWFENRRKDFVHLSEYESEIDHLMQWYENAGKIDSNQNSRLLWLQAYPSYHWGKYYDTFDSVKLALELYEKNSKEDSELNANIINDLGVVYGLLGNAIKALEYKEQALKIREKQLGLEHPDTAMSLNNVGYEYRKIGDYKKALEFYDRALDIRKKQLGPEHPDTARSLNNVGFAYGALGDHKKELEFYDRAIKILGKQLGPEHPDMANSLNNVGGTYLEIGNHKKALEFQERALKILEKQLGPEHPDTANSLNNVGGTYLEIGNHKKALEFQERALKILEKQLGPEHPDTANSVNNVIFALLKVKRFPDAYKLLKNYLKVLPREHSEYNYFISLNDRINRESIKSGFRPPSSINASKKKKKSKKR